MWTDDEITEFETAPQWPLPTRTADVLKDDTLTQYFSKARRKRAPYRIARATCCKRIDHR